MNGSAKYYGQRDRVRFRFFLHAFNIRDFAPSTPLLPEKSRERRTRTCGPRSESLGMPLDAVARRDIHNRGPDRPLMTARWKFSLDQPMSLFARVIRSLAPPKFRARVEIEARSPGDRESFPKMYNKFLSVFRVTSRTQDYSFHQSTHCHKTLVKTRSISNALVYSFPLYNSFFAFSLPSSFFTITFF